MSGVYIPKMKLPRNCGECPFFVDDGEFPFVEDGTWCGRANYLICDGIVNRDSKPEWCDLIPVPDHGDLIDYDFCLKNYELLHDDDGNPVYAVRMRDINNAPTIIPADKEKRQ